MAISVEPDMWANLTDVKAATPCPYAAVTGAPDGFTIASSGSRKAFKPMVVWTPAPIEARDEKRRPFPTRSANLQRCIDLAGGWLGTLRAPL
jgi:hypothetical protein